MRNTLGTPSPRSRDRRLVPDAVLAVLLAAAAVPLAYLPSPFGSSYGAPAAPDSPGWPGLTLIVAGCLATALRRRRPFLMLCLVVLVDMTLAALSEGGSLLWLATLWLVYTVAAHRGLALSLCALAVGFTGRVASGALRGDLGDWSAHLLVIVLATALWLAGRSLRLRRAYLSELRERAGRMERAREADTRAARAEERSRIARELHDVVAHHVSVMTVQAAAARRVLASNPDGAREALSAIEKMGRTAMAEMRNIVGVLRTDQGAPAEREPQPGVHGIPSLVAQMREAGLSTQLSMVDACGAPADGGDHGGDRFGPLPPGVDLAAYRLVQEALTNSLRHAGAGAHAWVTVRHEPGELTVHVEDDGRGAHVDRTADGPADRGRDEGGRAGGGRAAAERIGHGLVGIRERVALYGGILRIGPRPEGGFEVRARFPLKDS
ncbi:sensor histidine kinase [Planobispora siamensis]|uniref:histidine kinase n=1 Tax=Planobispora siamensis TaxID=936338 RepID=A0A8J3SVN8_9ACTN|nr:sensor histidine kinase [Planobispora siamensis]GIH96403.1 two-component sensor histidine kinase [Planobispora siamensis]